MSRSGPAPAAVTAVLVAMGFAGCLEPNIDPGLDLTVRVVHAGDAASGPPPGTRNDFVSITVAGAERTANTGEGGEAAFHDLPPGDANVTVLTRRYGQPQMQSQIVTVGGEPVTVEYRFPT